MLNGDTHALTEVAQANIFVRVRRVSRPTPSLMPDLHVLLYTNNRNCIS